MIFFDIKLRVQYHETDQMGIVHHSNYLKYFEMARIEMLRNIGIVYKEIEEKMGILMPVHSLSVKYIKPIYYDENIRINVSFQRDIKYKMKFNYNLYNDKEELCCKSDVEIVFLDKLTNKILIAPKELKKIVDNI